MMSDVLNHLHDVCALGIGWKRNGVAGSFHLVATGLPQGVHHNHGRCA